MISSYTYAAFYIFKGQFVAVVGYPHFLHLLDIGNGHDPSHHIILDWFSLPISKFVKSFRRIVNMPNKNGFKNPYSLIFINDEISKVELEINSGLLVPLFLQSKYPDLNFSIAVTHYLIIHMSDINAAKKVGGAFGGFPSKMNVITSY